MDTRIDMIRQKSLVNVDVGGEGGGVGENNEKSSSP